MPELQQQRSVDWLSPRDAAIRVGIGRRSIYKAIQSGELKAAMVNGRDLRIAASWLQTWMERLAK